MRDDLCQALKPRRFQLLIEDAHSGQVPARPVEASHETDRDRVAAAGKRDGDGGCGSLGGARGGVTEGGDDRHVAAHEIGRERRQSVELFIRPAKIDRGVAVGNVAALGENFVKRGDCARTLIAGVQEPDGRQLGWFCSRRERPRGRCTAKQRDELAAFHGASPPTKNRGELSRACLLSRSYALDNEGPAIGGLMIEPH